MKKIIISLLALTLCAQLSFSENFGGFNAQINVDPSTNITISTGDFKIASITSTTNPAGIGSTTLSVQTNLLNWNVHVYGNYNIGGLVRFISSGNVDTTKNIPLYIQAVTANTAIGSFTKSLATSDTDSPNVTVISKRTADSSSWNWNTWTSYDVYLKIKNFSDMDPSKLPRGLYMNYFNVKIVEE